MSASTPSKKIEITSQSPPKQDLEKWLAWLLEQDRNKNPADDDTGQRTPQNQGRYPKFFLAGSLGAPGKTIQRRTTVPANQEIFSPVATTDASFLEHPDATNEEELRSIARAIANLHKDIEFTITAGDESHSFRVADASQEGGDLGMIETDAIPVIFPQYNIYRDRYGVRGGVTTLVAFGWGVTMKLQPGEYALKMKARHDQGQVQVSGKTIMVPEFKLDVEYELTAVPGFTTLEFRP